MAIGLASIVALGLALRVAASRSQPPIVDELLSFLGAQTVAQRGIPLLPSGVLYLHGAVQSYLLAPLLALGLGSPANMYPLRLASAVAGAIAIALTFRLARAGGATSPAALFAAALVAIDPASVLWGGYLRMYAFAQLLAIAVALLLLKAISVPPASDSGGKVRPWASIALVIVFWLAVFTHLATALLWPAIAVVAVVVFGRDLFRGLRDLTLALAACLLAPLTLVALTGTIGPGAGTTIAGRAEGLPGLSFLGEENVNLAQILHPDPSPWTALFAGGPLALLVPLLLALASGLLVGRFLFAPRSPEEAGRMRSVGALLALYWLPILALAMFASDAAERYAVFLLPSGYVLVALAVESLVAPALRGEKTRWAAVGGGILALAFVVQGIIGSARLEQNQAAAQAAGPTAEAFVAAHRQPGELILTSGAVDTALAMGRLPELRFLPGGEGSQRALRYTRFTSDGQAIDYWIGMPSLFTTKALCGALAGSPGSWIVLSHSVWKNWGFNDVPERQMEHLAEPQRELILGLADQVYEDPDSLVFRSRPLDAWNNDARSACQEPAATAGGRDHQRPRDDAGREAKARETP